MWELLLRMILDAVRENRGVQVEFYNRFQYTVEVSALPITSQTTLALFDCEHSDDRRLLGETRVISVKIIIATITIIL